MQDVPQQFAQAPCLRCEYDLTGIQGIACPECGLDAITMESCMLRALTGPERARARSATQYIGDTFLISTVSAYVLLLGEPDLFLPGAPLVRVPHTVVFMSFCLAFMMPGCFYGVLQLSQISSSLSLIEGPRRLRRRACRLSLIALGLFVLSLFVFPLALPVLQLTTPLSPSWQHAISIAAGLPTLLLGVAAFHRGTSQMTEHLALRVPDAELAARARRYARILPLLDTVGVAFLGLGPLIAAILNWRLVARLRRQLNQLSHSRDATRAE